MYASPLSRPALLSVLQSQDSDQFYMPSLLHDAFIASSRVSRQTFPISRLYTSSQEESLPAQKNRNHHSSKALSKKIKNYQKKKKKKKMADTHISAALASQGFYGDLAQLGLPLPLVVCLESKKLAKALNMCRLTDSLASLYIVATAAFGLQ